MALIVEDGTGLANADSYVSVADADIYASAMGHFAWTDVAVTVEQKEVALRRATQYIDAEYTFRGSVLDPDQALEWPREEYSWPIRAVVHACCELAVRGLSTALLSDVDASSVKREKVGQIETEYFDPQNGGQVRYAVVDNLLRSVVTAGRNTLRIERA